jgi:acylphosphatase
MKLWACVKGHVQGVGFRFFVQHHAEALGLDGWVKNLPDGGVEVQASGEPQALDRFEALLSKGPPGAYVEHVAVSRGEGEADGSGFSVRFF